MVFTLPAELRKRYDAIQSAIEAMEGPSTPAQREDISRAAADFFLLLVEHFARHADMYSADDWQVILVDYVHEFVRVDDTGDVENLLHEAGIDDVILECCELDSDAEVAPPAQRLQTVRAELLDIKARFDELSFL